ncbi:MAG: tetratricopeptide repeat protein, partial [Pseudobdellovibrionaceae bacterium]
AQNKLVGLVEGAPQNLEVRALLCLTYKELWPLAYQDAQDLKTVALVAQMTKVQNAVSPYSQICDVVKLQTQGKYNEARGVLDTILDGPQFSLSAVANQFKGEMLDAYGESNHMYAINYFQVSSQFWPAWLKPQVQQSLSLLKANKAVEAVALLQAVLKKNPMHERARIHLGLIQKKIYHKNESALSLLINAIDSGRRIDLNLQLKAYKEIAEIYLVKGEKKKALEYAQRGYQKNPNNTDLKDILVRLGGDLDGKNKYKNNEMMFLGDELVRQGKHLDAQAEFKAAYELDKTNAVAAMKAAKSLWKINQSYEAIDWLGKAIKADPSFITAYVLQADYLSQRFDFNRASQVLTKALQASGQNYEVFKGLALLEMRKNNMLAAVQYGQRSLKIYDADVETYIILSTANTSLATSIVPSTKSEIERKENAQKDAIRFATKAVELDSTNPDSQIVYAKVIAQFSGADQGILYLKELEKKFSYTLDYKIALAEVYKNEERYNLSLAKYEEIVDIDPKNKKAWLGLGESSHSMGLMDKALKAFLTAAAKDPSDAEAIFQAGKLYMQTQRFAEAIKEFERVQRINPNFPRTDYYIGKAFFAQGDFAKAIQAAQNEKKKNPNLADSYILAAETFYAKKQYSECSSEYSTAMKLRPQGAEIYVKSAQCYRLSGSIEIAEDMLALALERENGYAEIYKEQGAIYEMKGDTRSAIQSYNKYLGLAPNALDKLEIENKINKIGGRW